MSVEQPLASPGSAKYINVVVRAGRVVGNYILSGIVYLGDVKPLCPFRECFETRPKIILNLNKFTLNLVYLILFVNI